MFTKEEQEFRRSIIGASQVGGLIGVSKHPNKIELFNWLVNGVPLPEAGVFAEVGTHMEPWVAENFIETYSAPGAPVVLMNPREVWPDTYGILRHPEYPWIGATMDRFIQGSNCPVEVKFLHNPQTISEYGPDGEEIFPDVYHIQNLIQLVVMRENCKLWGIDVPEVSYHHAYLGGRFCSPLIRWNPQTEVTWRTLLSHLIAFREDYWVPSLGKPIAEQIAPPVTSEDSYADYLIRRRDALGDSENVRIDESEEIVDLFKLRNAAGNIEALAEAAKKYYNNKLLKALGEDIGVKGSYGSFKIIGGKPSQKPDWEAIAKSLMLSVPADVYAETVKQHTREFTSARYARPYPAKNLMIDATITDSVIGMLMSPPDELKEVKEDE